MPATDTITNPELDKLLATASNLPTQDLPHFLGQLREVEATALARLNAPAQAQEPGHLVSVQEAAKRIGVSISTIYHSPDHFHFLRRHGGRWRASSQGIDRYIEEMS